LESTGVVAVVAVDELVDATLSITATSFDLMESSDVSAWDPDPLSMLIRCKFSMMHTFLTIEFDPALLELFLPATRLTQGIQDDPDIIGICH
jgi:hypothetical protein